MSKPSKDWTEAEESQLVTMQNMGKSARQIALALGKTRSAVLGKAKRMRDRKTPTPGIMPVQRKEAKNGPRMPKKAKTLSQPQIQPVQAPKPLMLSVLEIESGQCRYAIGEPGNKQFGFCGHKAEAGSSYCQHHYSVVYNKIPASGKKREERHGLFLAARCNSVLT